MGAKKQMGLMQMLTGTLFTPISPLQLVMPQLSQMLILGVPFGYILIGVGLYMWATDKKHL